MTEGLLLQDNSGRPIEQIIEEAIQAYQTKHGIKPNVCYIHRGLKTGEFNVNGVRVIPAGLLVHHFWIGRVEAEDEIHRSDEPSGPGMEQRT